MNALDNYNLVSNLIDSTIFEGCPRRNPNDYIFLKNIGEGSFSTVYRVKEVASNAEFAIKVIDKDHIERYDKTEAVIREKNILNYLTQMCGAHPFVSHMYTSFHDVSRYYLVLNLADGGNLAQAIKHFGSFPIETSNFFAAEILVALDFIHHHNIIHRDLKPENVLIKADGHIMISDFGSAQAYQDLNLPTIGFGEEATSSRSSESSSPGPSARQTSNQAKSQSQAKEETAKPGERRTTFVGTALYVSPEMLTDGLIGPHTDMWALGGILYLMLSGETPFRAVNHFHLLKRIQALDYEFPVGFPEGAVDICTNLFSPNPLDRMESDELKDTEYFAEIDWETLAEQEPPVLHAYIPASFGEPEFHSSIIEPGFDDKTQVRLMNIDLNAELEDLQGEWSDMSEFDSFEGAAEYAAKIKAFEGKKKNGLYKHSVPAIDEFDDFIPRTRSECETFALTRAERMARQRAQNPWHIFCNGELILKQGLLEKKRGLFARKRMFVLTEGPHLLYIDPSNNELKGEIPWTPCMQVEVKNFGTFFIHTPNRVYYLYDPAHNALKWEKAILATKERYEQHIQIVYETAMREGNFSELYGKKKTKKEMMRLAKAQLRKEKKDAKKREKMLARQQQEASQQQQQQ